MIVNGIRNETILEQMGIINTSCINDFKSEVSKELAFDDLFNNCLSKLNNKVVTKVESVHSTYYK